MSPDGAARTLSPKGEREAARILAAATTVLAREGFGGATLGRIAAEAGVDKKMVVYYFSGRDALLAELIRRVSRQVAANITEAIVRLSAPGEAADAGVDTLWAGTVEEPELYRAYLALVAGSRGSGTIGRALAETKGEFEQLFEARIAALEQQGYRLREDRAGYVTLMLAIWRGLALEWTEGGDPRALTSALEQFKRVALTAFEPH